MNSKLFKGWIANAMLAFSVATIAATISTASYAETKMVEVQSSFTDQEIVTLLKNEGYDSVEIMKKEMISFKSNGTTLAIGNSKDYLFIVYMMKDTDTSYEKLNEWNLTYSLGIAHRYNKDKIYLNTSLNLRAGLSKQQVITQIKGFSAVVDIFKQYIHKP